VQTGHHHDTGSRCSADGYSKVFLSNVSLPNNCPSHTNTRAPDAEEYTPVNLTVHLEAVNVNLTHRLERCAGSSCLKRKCGGIFASASAQPHGHARQGCSVSQAATQRKMKENDPSPVFAIHGFMYFIVRIHTTNSLQTLCDSRQPPDPILPLTLIRPPLGHDERDQSCSCGLRGSIT
jgi:hypothetical protein